MDKALGLDKTDPKRTELSNMQSSRSNSNSSRQSDSPKIDLKSDRSSSRGNMPVITKELLDEKTPGNDLAGNEEDKSDGSMSEIS